jgi:hypothetical protein
VEYGVDAAGLEELFEGSFECGCQPLDSTKGKEFPEQLRQLWLLQDGVSKRNVRRKISCSHLSLSVAAILQNVTQGFVFVHVIRFCIKFILLVSVTY